MKYRADVMLQKTALITGITGQDGSYLAELLFKKNYHLIGLDHHRTVESAKNLRAINSHIKWSDATLTSLPSLLHLIQIEQPDEIYHLAAQSHAGHSWSATLETAEINALGAHRLFEAVLQAKPECRIFQASSSDMFGQPPYSPQHEKTPFNPLNPYAVTKVYAHQMAAIYRKMHNLYISCGILYNHESPRRGFHFVSQKIAYGAACIKLGIETSSALNEMGDPVIKNGRLVLGNLEARRDWGAAVDTVEAMWLMLQQPNADDYVIGTGKTHSIRDLCQIAFSHVGLQFENHVRVDPRFIRSLETTLPQADFSKAKKELGWQPKTSFETVIKKMVDAHLKKLSKTV